MYSGSHCGIARAMSVKSMERITRRTHRYTDDVAYYVTKTICLLNGRVALQQINEIPCLFLNVLTRTGYNEIFNYLKIDCDGIEKKRKILFQIEFQRTVARLPAVGQKHGFDTSSCLYYISLKLSTSTLWQWLERDRHWLQWCPYHVRVIVFEGKLKVCRKII